MNASTKVLVGIVVGVLLVGVQWAVFSRRLKYTQFPAVLQNVTALPTLSATAEQHDVTEEQHDVTEEQHDITEEQHDVTEEQHDVTDELSNVSNRTQQQREGAIVRVEVTTMTSNERKTMIAKLEQYRNDMEMFKKYNSLHRTATGWSGQRYIVYLCHRYSNCNGWSDRQSGIFSTYLLSVVTNRIFKVEMTYPHSINHFFHPGLLDWTVNQSEFQGLSRVHIRGGDHLDRVAFRDSMQHLDFNSHFPEDVVYITSTYSYLYELLENPVYSAKVRIAIQNKKRPRAFSEFWTQNFILNAQVREKVNKALSEGHPTPRHTLVCAHVRFGRNPTIPLDSVIRNNLTTVAPLWPFFQERSDRKRFRIFVASDWQGFVDRVHKRFASVFVEVKGEIIHIHHLDKKKELPQELAMEKVIVDQVVLSKCDVFVMTKSGLGRKAAWLRDSAENLYYLNGGKLTRTKVS